MCRNRLDLLCVAAATMARVDHRAVIADLARGPGQTGQGGEVDLQHAELVGPGVAKHPEVVAAFLLVVEACGA